MPTVILRGYYGFGNLGDDILLMVTAKWIKGILPGSKLVVCTAGGFGSYIQQLTDGMVDQVSPLEAQPPADLVVHGGGGTYFDFDSGGAHFRIFNRLVDAITPSRWRSLMNLGKMMRGKFEYLGSPRIALGIGVGQFTKDSKKYYNKIAELAGFDLIVVRDSTSYSNLSRKNLKAEIWKSTDLAFLSQYWLDRNKMRVDTNGKKIGLIVRPWKWKRRYLETVLQCANELESSEYSVTVFFFEKPLDQSIAPMFKKFDQYYWDPHGDLNGFLEILSEQNLCITSRAHGVLIAAALGIPSVCLGIEPKLHTFHKLLPNASVYQECPLQLAKLLEKVESAINIPGEVVAQDFQLNFEIANSTMLSVNNWLQKKINPAGQISDYS